MFAFMKQNSGQPVLSARDIVAKADAGEITIIDVRDPTEVQMSGKAEGAINIPLAVLNFQTDPRHPDFHAALDCDRPVALYCASGGRSAMAAQVMERNGFAEVHNIGGLAHWAQAGGKIAR